MEKKVIIVGGGVAGMQAAITLSGLGLRPVIVERGEALGGKLRDWHRLFPSFTPSSDVLSPLLRSVEACGAEVITGVEVSQVDEKSVVLSDGRRLEGEAVVVCSGYDLFDASIKEEYGYGIYPNVYTTVDVERMMNAGRVATAEGKAPSRIALLHCVGSRDEKAGQRHCSRVCCVTAVKQAIELKEMFPEAEIYDFYMDIRMFGPGYEEMYRRAQQEFNIHFVRGRISEASQTIDGRIQFKAEDTLVGRPLRMSVDMLILVVGMTSTDSNLRFAQNPGIDLYPSGFIRPRDMFDGNVCSQTPSIYYAGTATAPKNIGESLNEGTTAAYKVYEYLTK